MRRSSHSIPNTLLATFFLICGTGSAAVYSVVAQPAPTPETFAAHNCIDRGGEQPSNSYATALCLARARSPLDAAAYLLANRQRGRTDLLWRKSEQLLAVLYQKLGLLDRARAEADTANEDWTSALTTRFQLQQARAWLTYDKPARTQRVLGALADLKNPEFSERRQSLLALAQMQQANFAGALKTLEDKQSFPKRDLVGHYNYAVALVRAGRTAEGLALLDEVGTVNADNRAERGIRDRANLQLGWAWLRDKKGGTARPIFKRIRLQGPYSDMALLGLGWAELAPDDEPQKINFERTLFCPDIQLPHPDTHLYLFYMRSSGYCRKGTAYPFRMFHKFAYDPSAHDKGRFVNALKYWTELSNRNVAEPAVQEALLASGYAYQQAGALGRAEDAYVHATTAYALEAKRRKLLMRALEFPTNNPLDIIRRREFAGYFDALRSSNALHSAGRAAADLQKLNTRLEQMQARIRQLADSGPRGQLQRLQIRSQQLMTAIPPLRGQLLERLRRRMVETLTQQNKNLNTYQRAAQSALAQLYNTAGYPRPPEAQTETSRD